MVAFEHASAPGAAGHPGLPLFPGANLLGPSPPLT